MPIYRIAEQFRIEGNMFDVVLVDEASQAGLEASFLQYLAPKIIVVGDDKQVSPSAVGVDQQQLRDLANQYLANNPFKASWQDPKRSYFDEATMRFGGKITLVEHRRCVPEIIGFSNKIAYEPENIRLIPVRQRSSGALTPIRRVHVPTGYEKGRTNPAEADAIVAQMVACAADPAYDGKTFGVISLMGKEQAKLIATKLLDKLDPEDWIARDLRCGDAADFQGSERDVVFLSMVKAAEPGRRVGASTAEMYVQRYNVAASRAKDQMWLFHSLLLSDLGNPEDMRHALLDYVSNVETRQDQSDDRIRKDLVPDDYRVDPFDSLFEQRVFNRIHGRGYAVIPQFPAEGYNIDLVVVGVNGNLAIECDGDTWHGPEHYLKDLARQRDLERCGWTFFRIRESAYYLDADEALADLWPQLEALTAADVAVLEEPDAVVPIENDGRRSQHEVPPPPPAPAAIDLVEPDPAPVQSYAPRHAVRPLADSLNGSHALAAFDPSDDSEFDDEPAAPNLDAFAAAAAAFDDPDLDYAAYQGQAAATHAASRSEIIDSLVAIVRVEGPVRGSRLQTAYVKASGGMKVGSQIAKDLNGAVSAAVRQKRLIEDNPLSESGVKPKTYRLPDQPVHRVRPLGPRTIDEVPPMELAARLSALRASTGSDAQPETLFRSVLEDLGLKRLTPNVEALLARALDLVDEATRPPEV
jgi:very-short-patch-repair endonuclease